MARSIPETVVRGNYVDFAASFFDSAGEPVAPDSATLYVFYLKDDESKLDTVVMTATSDPTVWSGRWNSSGVDPATVSWSVLGRAGSLTMAQDGSLDVSANNANQVGTHS